MRFAYAFPWWLAFVLVAASGALAALQYRRPLSPLTRARRGTLVALRMLSLLAIAVLLFRPVVMLPAGTRDAVVPVLVDVSRSMRLADADGQTRLARASALVKDELLPALSQRFAVELYAVGDGVQPIAVDELRAEARRSDLSSGLDAVRQRTRGRPVAGIVILSDGGETGHVEEPSAADESPPVFAIGVGSPAGLRDREVVGVTAGLPHLGQASVDLHVTASHTGFGRAPFQLRLLANGQLIDSRRIVPRADEAPVEETFTVAPDPLNPTVYTAEIPPADGEAVLENNARTVVVSPAGRKRRVLVVEGAPGFEHTFMKRAWAQDAGLDVDSVVRKGRNGEGQDTFLVQAGAGRSAALATGFPNRREDLFPYDALVLANLEADALARAQLAMAAEFVEERGGGLLVLGGRSFAARGLIGTPLEEALPVELSDRRGTLVRVALGAGQALSTNKLAVTAEGESHPIMRIGDSLEDSRRRWAALPPLASSALVGGARAGATVLAVTAAPSGAVRPVVAVQRYGRGRSMIFAGEASWRWRMLLPSADRSHELFWRQAARWLAAPTPDPVSISVPDPVEPGDAVQLVVEARDAAFQPVADATLDVSIAAPGEDPESLTAVRADAERGRFTAPVRPARAGLHRIHAEARRGTTLVGVADGQMYVGGVDREFVDPRLNEEVLRRFARRSGGRYLAPADASRLVPLLQATAARHAASEQRDLWHEPWVFALVVALLSAEWILRRRWGLR